MKKLPLPVLAISLFLSGCTQAASFDCAKAATKTEKMICADEKISKLDEEMAALYKQAREKSNDKALFIEDHKRWLRVNRNKCFLSQCLYDSYVVQIEALKGVIQTGVVQRRRQIKISKEELDLHKLEHIKESTTVGAEKYRGHYKLVRDGIKKSCADEVDCKRIHSEMCGELEKSLNSFPDKPPMVCERFFNEKFGFIEPAWQPVPDEKIDWDAYRKHYIETPIKVDFSKDAEQGWKDYEASLKQLQKEGKPILWVADMNWGIDAAPLRLYRLGQSPAFCNVDRFFSGDFLGSTYMILDKEGANIPRELKNAKFLTGDIFGYKGDTYIASWRRNGSNDKKSRVPLENFVVERYVIKKHVIGMLSHESCGFQFVIDKK